MTFLNDDQISKKIEDSLAFLSPRRVLPLQALLPLVGLEPSQQRYRAAMFPNDPMSTWADLSKRSSCGWTTEIGLRAAGWKEPALYLPCGLRAAKGGRLYPVALERDVAMKHHAWREPDVKTNKLPLEGDPVIVGFSGPGVWGKGGLSVEHEFTVGAIDQLYADVGGAQAMVHSIDGGQPGIHCRTRAFLWCGPNGDELWAAALDDDGGYVLDPHDMLPTKGRRVLGWVDTDAAEENGA